MPRFRSGSLLARLSFFIILSPVPASAAGVTLYVSPSGSDSNTCLPSLPCREIRRAVELVGPGDTILVANGTYKGFTISNVHGSNGNPITIKAQGSNAVVVKTVDRSDNRDTIFITFSSYITVDGLRSFNANRAAIRVDESPRVTIRNCVFGNNATWGIFTDFSDDLLIENNETYGSVAEHGIYVSNSGDRPVVRGNRSHNNTRAGIHVNGDIYSGGDGIISGALIENNVVYNNGTGGAAGINMDGVQDSIIRNNVIYNNHATGISLYQIDGGGGPKGNKVYHNTVYSAADSRWAIIVWNTEGPITMRNNVFISASEWKSGINYSTPADAANTDSDYNILDRATSDEGNTNLSLAEWQAQGHELHSFSATPASLFVNAAGANYHLSPSSPAIDHGQTLSSVKSDFEGTPRPKGAASDVGADETGGGSTPSPELTVTPPSLSFGSVNVGSTAERSVTVRNTGGGQLTGSASTAGIFKVVGAASYSLGANQTARITVRFSPNASGTVNGSLNLTGGGGGSVSLSGTGVAVPPALAVTPTSLSFGTVNVGSAANLAVTVRNSGGGTLTGAASTAAPFSVVGTASYSLAANQSARITVRFSPTAYGAASRTLTLTGAAGGSVGLGGTGAASSAGEPVAWASPGGVAVSGNNLKKNVPVGWGNSGATSTKALVSGAGYVEHTIQETNTRRMLGLGNGSTNNTWEDIDFGLYAMGNGKLQVHEKGVLRGSFGPYSSGDKLRIAVTSGIVRYYRNSALLFSSPTAPTYPLVVDTALYTPGATLAGVIISGNWVASNAEPVQWTAASGVSVAGNSLTKNVAMGWGNAGAISSKSLLAGDGFAEHTIHETDTGRMLGLGNGNTSNGREDIDFSLNATAGGMLRVYEKGVFRGTFGSYASGDRLRIAVVGGVVRYYRNTSLLYSSTKPPTYPLVVDTALNTPGATLAKVVISRNWSSPFNQPVAWKSATGVVVSANNLTKSAPIGWGNAGAISTKSLLAGDGFVEHTVRETNTYRMIGLSHGSTNASWDDIDFALCTVADGTLRVFEKGTLRRSLGAYAYGDKLRVAVSGGVVRYYRNGTVLYTSTMAPEYPLIVDTALYTSGATLSAVMISRTFQ
jgi:Right handed beta helix region/Abnormal spindle-like microcephaly-assoc'd, ASPM-SPD-2-Hydin/HYDIN/CFA65/VesB-like, Ig-like domain